MSNSPLPEELLDYTIDFLQDSRDALRVCCLISKLWIPRCRKHLFAHIGFCHASNLQSWKTTFPDPSTSPARYAKTLLIGCPEFVAPEDAEDGGWIPTFTRVVHLKIDATRGQFHYSAPDIPLGHFQGLSPILKSLHITSSSLLLQTFDLVCSFPLLEDLSLVVSHKYGGRFRKIDATQPSTPQPFTGTLKLSMHSGTSAIASLLLSLPSGLHFQKLDLVGVYENESPLATALVERCCHTLGSIIIRGPVSGSIDLSKATKLVDVQFSSGQNPRWIAETLRTITHDHRSLRQISISTFYAHLRPELSNFDPTDHQRWLIQNADTEWLELDRLLAQLGESHPIRLEVLYYLSGSAHKGKARSYMENLLPELTMRGMVDLVEREF